MAEPTVRDEPGHDCVLCPPLRFRVNGMAGLPGESGVIAGDRDFFLIPDVAPLAEGHLLLVTREHHQCAGDFPGPMWERAMRWRDRVARLYREAYGLGGLLLFEHGRRAPRAVARASTTRTGTSFRARRGCGRSWSGRVARAFPPTTRPSRPATAPAAPTC
ncbi:hypothetical protein ACFQY7_14775 [Actinomadura luteofluorescens]|uniref:hypothetical protein n=1 Tax=Actinomadura luteofluorescens TaxID=46163 RepID=UPI0036285ADA